MQPVTWRCSDFRFGGPRSVCMCFSLVDKPSGRPSARSVRSRTSPPAPSSARVHRRQPAGPRRTEIRLARCSRPPVQEAAEPREGRCDLPAQRPVGRVAESCSRLSTRKPNCRSRTQHIGPHHSREPRRERARRPPLRLDGQHPHHWCFLHAGPVRDRAGIFVAQDAQSQKGFQ